MPNETRRLRADIRKALGRTPPKAPVHALQRASVALGTRTPVRCSRFGAPGGCYLAVVAQEAPKRRIVKPGAGVALPTSRSVKPRKIRRVGHETAHAVIRRAPSKTPHEDRIVALYWIPPEVEVLLSRDDLRKVVLANKIRPVWTQEKGRTVERGDDVTASAVRR